MGNKIIIFYAQDFTYMDLSLFTNIFRKEWGKETGYLNQFKGYGDTMLPEFWGYLP